MTHSKEPQDADRRARARITVWEYLKEPKHANAIGAIVAAVIATSTIVYTAATIVYTRISAKQFEAAQMALQQDRRAYLVLNLEMPASLIRPHQPVIIKGTLTNKGKTPAKNLIIEVIVSVMPSDDEPLLDYREAHAESSSALFQPDEKRIEEFVWLQNAPAMTPELPSKATVAALGAGKAYLVVYGKITYQDIYGVDHWLHFCEWQDFAGIPLPYKTRVCVDYNSVDSN